MADTTTPDSGPADKNAPLLLMLITLSIIGTLLLILCFFEIPKENAQIINIVLGALLGSGLTQGYNFYYGSTKSNKDKDAATAAATTALAAVVPKKDSVTTTTTTNAETPHP